jgi:hypothetical protein
MLVVHLDTSPWQSLTVLERSDQTMNGVCRAAPSLTVEVSENGVW